MGGAGAGHTETAHCLLVAGADPDCAVTCSGNTALHAAAEVSVNKYHPSESFMQYFCYLQGDQLEVARLLLDFGADTQITNK